MKWTPQQRAAIEKSGCNLIVGAAAGSGKTTVLVERIIRKISVPGCDIDSMLITTFTEAAAAKMKADIKSAIEQKLAENPADRHLAKQALLIGRADISTIHSFCMRTVRANFQQLDIDPDFRICDDNEAKLLKEQALDEAFEYFYENADVGFYELLDTYSDQRGDFNLRAIVLKLYSFIKSMPFYEKWIEKSIADYDNLDDFEKTKYYDAIKKNVALTLSKHLSAYRIGYEESAAQDFLAKYKTAFEADIVKLENIEAVIKTGTREDIAAALAGFSNTRADAPGGVDDALKKYLQKVRDEAAGDISGLYSSYFAGFDGKIKLLKESKSRVCALFDAVKKLDECFLALKAKRAMLDFNDIEHYCLEVLSDTDKNGEAVPSKAALALKERYTEILVDEYQDANEMQETIFKLISRGNNIFMVGDLKQSIYRFRHTNPLLFKDKMEKYSDGEGVNQRVIMAENFRSRKAVIDCVNYIFEQVSSETVGEMTYDKKERLNFAANYPDAEKSQNVAGAAELILVGGDRDKSGADDELTGFEAEAQAICDTIKKLKREGYMVYDKKTGYRPLRLSDIVILLRSPKNDGVAMANILEQNRLSCFADVGGGYFDSEEINVVMSILSVIDNPRQDIPLLAAMRSPVFEFDENELVKIRLFSSEGDIYKAVSDYAGGGDEAELCVKCKKLIECFSEWREKSVYMTAYELIDTIYNDTGYYAYAGAMPGGDVRRGNLRLLYKRAEAFESTSYKGLFNFISFIEKLSKAPKDSKGARMLGENQDVVRIMSIHKSKGLEFPVVFVAGLNKKFNLSDTSESVLMHKHYGIGVNFVDSVLRYKAPLMIRDILSEIVHDELLSEELRLLYVALTRAREKLYMCAYVKDLEQGIASWLRIASEAESLALPLYRCREAKAFTDWIVPALLRSGEGARFTNSTVSATGSEIDIKIRRVQAKSGDISDFEDIKADRRRVSEAVRSAVEFEYENPKAAYISQKLSVTELKRMINTELDAQSFITEEAVIEKKPAFLREEGGLTAAQKGSVTHFVMQNVAVDHVPDAAEISCVADSLADKGLLDEKQRKAVDIKRIVRFFSSDIAGRMLASPQVNREVPFEINIRADEVYSSYSGDEKILLQGIIDCYFEEDGKIVVLDYKTDRITSDEDRDGLIKKYSPQLEFYSLAVKRLTGISDVEKYIYFFSDGSTARL